MRVRRHAQASHSMDLVQTLIDQSVSDPVVPVDDLAGLMPSASRCPVCVVTSSPRTIKKSSAARCPIHRVPQPICACRRDEVEPGGTGSERQLFGSEFSTARAHRVDMGITAVPGRPRPTARTGGKPKFDTVLPS